MGLQFNRSTCIFVVTTLFTVASLFQIHSILCTSSRTPVQTPLHTNASLFYVQPVSSGIPGRRVETKRKLHARATVTGASSNHFDVLIGFLQNYKAHCENIPLFTYDLGLTATEVAFVRANYSWTTLRTFNFSQYPPYFKIEVAMGEYAWKPIIVKEMLDTTTSAVLWLDSGDRLTRANTIQKIFSRIEKNGHATTMSPGTTQDWVHPATLTFLHAPNLKIRMCNAAIVGFDMRAYEKVVRPWAKCAMERVCIAPPGATRENHRQDQAVLTVLLHQAKRRFDNDGLGILIHQDTYAPVVLT